MKDICGRNRFYAASPLQGFIRHWLYPGFRTLRVLHPGLCYVALSALRDKCCAHSRRGHSEQEMLQIIQNCAAQIIIQAKALQGLNVALRMNTIER